MYLLQSEMPILLYLVLASIEAHIDMELGGGRAILEAIVEGYVCQES